MGGLLEVIALHEADAGRAQDGGADRIELVGNLDDGGMSPEPGLVEQVRAATSIQIRPIVRLREGFGTDGGEFTRLVGLLSSYLEAGADGVVFGFLNGHGEIDQEVCVALAESAPVRWTFHRAVDHVFDFNHAWRALRQLPGLDQVLTAGSPRGVEFGLDEVLLRANEDPQQAAVIMAGGGLMPEHVPWLTRAGVRSFQIGRAARPQGSYKAYVDAPLVHTWRTLIDATVAHADALASG